MSKIETICEAIATRHLLQICYHSNYRVVEPNGYGIDATGAPVLLAWQIEGGGGWDNGHGWRVLAISAMEKITILEEPFSGARPQYEREGCQLQQVYAHA